MNWIVFEKNRICPEFGHQKGDVWIWAQRSKGWKIPGFGHFLKCHGHVHSKGPSPGKKCHANSSLSNVVGEGLASHNVLALLPGRRKTKGALRRRKTDEINILLDQLATFAKTFYSRWTSLEWKFHESCPVISWFQGTNLSECQQKWSNWALSSCLKVWVMSCSL